MDVENQDKPPELQKRFWSFALSKKSPPIPLEEERKPFPYFKANILSKLMIWWLNPILKVGYKRTLTEKDMFTLDDSQKVDVLYSKFQSHLSANLKNDSKADFKLLAKSLYQTFFTRYTIAVLALTLSDLTAVTSPLVQKKLINFVEYSIGSTNVSLGPGIGYAIACTLMTMLNMCLFSFAYYNLSEVGAQIRAVLTKLILEKAMTVNARGQHDFNDAKIQSLISTDLNRVDSAASSLPFGFICIPSVIISIALLISNIGVSALSGVAVFVLVIVVMAVSMPNLYKYRTSVATETDTRVNLTKELLFNFKMIKFYAWESTYEERISMARNMEMKYILHMQSLRNLMISFAETMPTFASMAAFCTFYTISSGQNAANIFSSLSLFVVLSDVFMYVPISLLAIIDMITGLKRISEFLSCEDYDESMLQIEFVENKQYAIKVDCADFKWETFDDELDKLNNTATELDPLLEKDDEIKVPRSKFPGLLGINLEINKGDFIVITGKIGSGKSSLLHAMSGFMDRYKGKVYHSGSSILCGYPWVQNATIRQNITFGLPYDKEKYDSIINACALTEDFGQFIGGDLTEVGERGITLSGGQKARINLARAVYADKDIIFMDDVLSAVDAKVGRHIVDNCILDLLKNKTRVLATHQLSLIEKADKMIFLNGDGSIDVGSIETLRESNHGVQDLFQYYETKQNENEEDLSVKLDDSDDKGNEEIPQLLENDGEIVKIVGDEDRAVNALGWTVYANYCKLGCGEYKFTFPIIFILLMTVSTFCNLFSNTWLTFWLQDKWPERSQSFYMGIYIMFTFLFSIFVAIEYILMSYFCTTAARILNLKAVSNTLHVPMAFMDISPLGRILNRFTKDTDVLDNQIIEQVRMVITALASIMGTITLCIIYIPWFAIALPLIMAMFVSITEYYQSSAREVKRLEAIERSFVYSHFNETLSGKTTIKSYGLINKFCSEINALIDTQNESYYIAIAVQSWLASNLAIVSSLIVLFISLCCVCNVFSVNASQTGLLLTYVMSLSAQSGILMRSMTQLENEFNSVERLNHYAFNLEQEKPYEIKDNDPSPEWPVNTNIKFENVSMKYRPELPYVLKNVSMDIKSKEKIGVCGRTGAGKSTFMTCLFRLTEFQGKIEIDGVDISRLGLRRLRSALSIIPQDPVLFLGTIRHNLDPFGELEDDTLWNALVTAGLIENNELMHVKNELQREQFHKFHLLQPVEDGGSNFSLGERQLIALARTLVRKSKILILDEATSSVDYKTDNKIQNTIVNEFSDCTVLCIAHRLKTILQYDRIIVMDAGEIVEFDTPWNLFKADTIFREMCRQSDISESDF